MERPISSMNERTRSWRFEFLTQLDLDFKIWRFLLRFSFRDTSVSIEHVLQILFSIVWKIYVLRAEKRLFISAWKIFHKTRRSSYSLVPKLRTIYKKNDNSNDTISLVASSRRPSRQLQLVNGDLWHGDAIASTAIITPIVQAFSNIKDTIESVHHVKKIRQNFRGLRRALSFVQFPPYC